MITGDDRALFERSLRHATETASGPGLDAALVELGWPDALAEDPRTAVSLLFELQGRSGTTSSALDAVLASALGASTAVLASSTAVLLPPLDATAAPGHPAGDGVDVAGVGTAALASVDVVVVGLADGAVAVDANALVRRPVAGLDPELGLVVAEGRAVAARPAGHGVAWDAALAVGQLALAHELVGASRTMLGLARDHALERIQFDQPIARFQAVRHRLADAHVAIESAADAAAAAWDDGSPLAAAAAKAIAGRSARLVARHSQQVLAGIGFTTEHPLHRSVRRVLVLDRLLGDARTITRAMGEELLRTRRVPPMLPL